MPHLIEENRARNKACANVGWLAADATTMELPPDSQDVVFSNWLLMYLSDGEVAKLAADALQWVRCSKGSAIPWGCAAFMKARLWAVSQAG